MTQQNNSIQIVIVLYKTALEDSKSFQSLKKHIGCLQTAYDLLIYNNSSEIFVPESKDYKLITAPINMMLAHAYNCALQEGVKNNHKWLLLLDQDTVLTKDYFLSLNMQLNRSDVAGIFPVLKQGEKHLSPMSFSFILGTSGRPNTEKHEGLIENKFIVACNSASVFSVEALNSIGGFPEEFPLDALDVSVCHKLSKGKKKFYLLGTELQHDLSGLNYASVTEKRYRSIIEAELKMSKQAGAICFLATKIHLFLRVVKQCFIKERRPYATTTLRYLFRYK